MHFVLYSLGGASVLLATYFVGWLRGEAAVIKRQNTPHPTERDGIGWRKEDDGWIAHRRAGR